MARNDDLQPAERERALQLLRRVTIWMAPEEVELFDVEGELLLDEAFAGRPVILQPREREEFRFGLDDWAEPVQLVAAIVGTVKTLLEILKVVNSRRSFLHEELRENWREQLVCAGLEINIANELARKFYEELTEIVKRR